MIEILNGLHETVRYREDTQILLYNNDEAENYPPHWHPPFEIILPEQNSYRALCGKQEFFIREGDILIISPGILHELFAPSNGRRIIFQIAASRIQLKELDLITSIISPAILITPEAYPQIHEKIRAMVLEIRDEYASSSPYSESIIYSKFLSILAYVGRFHAEKSQQNFDAKTGKQQEYMEKFLLVCNYINEHFAEPLTLEQTAALAGFSKYHFAHLFKQYADTTFYKYLNQQRMSHAKNLLIDDQYSVIEVALQSGFTNLSSFLRMFKLATGCTPSEFRKMYRSK